jgi:hypothetical protein
MNWLKNIFKQREITQPDLQGALQLKAAIWWVERLAAAYGYKVVILFEKPKKQKNMKEFNDFRKVVENRLSEEFPNSKIEIIMTRITEKKGIYVYETTAHINDEWFRGVGESAGKAIDDLLHERKYGRAYHEQHNRVNLNQ